MEIGLAILLFVCMTALLYVLLSLKITRQVDLQMKEFYKTRIHSDIQEFYREMENYSVMLENRIRQFKTLVERNEDAVRTHEAIASTDIHPPAAEVAPPAVNRQRTKTEAKKVVPQKKPVGAKARQAAGKPVAKQPIPSVQKTVRPAPTPVPSGQKASASVKAATIAQNFSAAEMPASAVSRKDAYHEEDSAIAEELMKDLYAQDEVQLSKQPAAKAIRQPVVTENESEGERTMAKFFSRLGKAIEPVIFGDKAAKNDSVTMPAASAAAVPEVKPQPAKPAANFSEVLRRAEQIKAEKKAERERAEVEARAEFFAAGDSFSAQNGRVRADSADVPAQAMAARPQRMSPVQQQTAGNISVARAAAQVSQRPEARNTLAVKDLDQHTINFLIDSLVKDNGYRRQALRALTENNIPLSEIARLSKIDIGELELMRQLGRF